MAAAVSVKKVLEDPVAVMATNMTGTERILRAIHLGGWNPRVVIASTAEVCGFNARSSFADNPLSRALHGFSLWVVLA